MYCKSATGMMVLNTGNQGRFIRAFFSWQGMQNTVIMQASASATATRASCNFAQFMLEGFKGPII